MEHDEILKAGQTIDPGEARTQALASGAAPADSAAPTVPVRPDSAPSVAPDAGFASPDAGLASPADRELALPAGASRVRLVVEVPENARLEVEVEARAVDGRLLGRQSLVFNGAQGGLAALPLTRAGWPARLAAWARAQSAALPLWLFWVALGIYAFTRLYALPSYPIFFFTDEAVQTVTAADLLRDDFRSPTGELLPTYFENGTQYNLSASVYLQVLPYFFLGKSVWVTRAAAALMTLIAAASVGMILKRVFKNPYPWLAVMFLSITPAWFLHSRTAFETALATSFYAAFLYFYLVYRTENPRYLYWTVAAGALAWYSYSGMRLIVAVTCLLLLLSDLKYHWQNRAVLLPAAGLTALLALPFIRFLINHPDASTWQMRLLGSYWLLDVPLIQKVGDFAAEYIHGLNPLYWYLPNNWDLQRHTMLGYGHLLRQTLPLGFLGIALALRRFRNPAYRTMLIAILAAPTGAAVVRLGITRVLVMVIPLAILTALATAFLIDWLHSRWKVSRSLVPLAVFALLAGINLYMLRDALVNGPLWFSDYGLTGQQYGAQQVFGAIKQYLKEKPDTHIILSPAWTNGTDVVARFFFEDPLPFELGSIDGYFNEVKPLDDKTLFIMIPEEYAKLPGTRFTDVRVEKVIDYPDGRPGFYFVRLKYVPDIQDVIAREETARRQPKTEQIEIGGQPAQLTYTPLDMGSPADLFDGSLDTLIRTDAINPMQLTFDFPQPRLMQSVKLRVGGADTTVHLQVWQAGQAAPTEYNQDAAEYPEPRDMQINFQSQVEVTRLLIEIKNTNDPPDGHVHLWEVTFK